LFVNVLLSEVEIKITK